MILFVARFKGFERRSRGFDLYRVFTDFSLSLVFSVFSSLQVAEVWVEFGDGRGDSWE